MLTHPLFEQLKTLRCDGMLEAFQDQLNTPDINRLSFDERFALLIEREYLLRENRKLTNQKWVKKFGPKFEEVKI